MSVSARIDCNIRWTDTDEVNEIQIPKDNFALTLKQLFADGAGLNQANIIYTNPFTTSATPSLDVYNSVLNWRGTAMTPSKLKAIVVKNDATTAGFVLKVGGDAAPLSIFKAANDKIRIGPGGIFLLTFPTAAGVAISSGFTDKLKFDAGGNSIPIRVALLLAA